LNTVTITRAQHKALMAAMKAARRAQLFINCLRPHTKRAKFEAECAAEDLGIALAALRTVSIID